MEATEQKQNENPSPTKDAPIESVHVAHGVTNRMVQDILKHQAEVEKLRKTIFSSGIQAQIEQIRKSVALAAPALSSFRGIGAQLMVESPIDTVSAMQGLLPNAHLGEEVGKAFRTMAEANIGGMGKTLQAMMGSEVGGLGKMFHSIVGAQTDGWGSVLGSPFAAQANQFTGILQSVSQSVFRSAFPEHFKKIEENRGASDALVAVGLFLAPSMEKKLLARITVHHQNKKKKSVISSVIRYYGATNQKRLRDAVGSWESNPLFVPRMKIIRDALDSHINGKYTLSVPTLLAQVEGIVNDFVVCMNLSLKPHKSEHLKEAIVHSPVVNLSALLTFEGLLEIFEKVYESRDFAKVPLKKRGLFNRHTVLHGRQVGYDTQINSLRAFLILDALSVLLVIDEEEAAKSKRKKRSRRTKKQIKP